MIREELLQIANNKLNEMTTAEVYAALIKLAEQRIQSMEYVSGKRKVYYMSAEFLVGKLLANNLMNLKIYDEVNEILSEFGHSLKEIEAYDPEPSLGNGGLGRLASCFLDSIATIGVNGEGLGLNYHFGLFKQVFQNNLQTEEKDIWLEQNKWLRKTDITYSVVIANQEMTSRMYELDIVGYRGKRTTLKLFDLESVDENLVEYGITFNQNEINKNLTLFLYPDDSTEAGLRLRFAQQYFMVKSGLSYIMSQHPDLSRLDQDVVIQINDTHPSMVILLLLQEMLRQNIDFSEAVRIVSKTCAYTNHTILAEALEKWPLSYFENVDVELVDIIFKLSDVVRAISDNEKIQILDQNSLVHMASLAIHFSYSTNGVAALHTDILVNSELKEFADLYPERFNNKTNGITFRRWLLFSNRPLADYLEELIGAEFKSDAKNLENLLNYQDDSNVCNKLLTIKQNKKIELANYLKHKFNIDINIDSIFDVQIKRLHEYKRQQMNMLFIIDLLLKIRNGHTIKRPITFFFGSKAAPAYTIAKDIIHALLTLANIIDNDSNLSKFIKIVFVENYNVTKAEFLIPACDVSEQISLASKEASGTGNMKLMLNGALTLGTLDGANVEIADLVGYDNIYIFGKDSKTIINHYQNHDYIARDYYENNQMIKAAVDYLISEEMLSFGHKEHLERLHHELISKDWFMTLIDLEDYVTTKTKMFNDYEDRAAWSKKMLINIAKAGYFSSDRTIEDYNSEIWKTN
ncbi:MAG: glycogen/starch/alpha-glucan family phosphorylase [Erysipelotrichaceae bacterium]